MVSLYTNPETQTIPNKCIAVQNAVSTHDAMIASSGTGTAGPLMGTMHSLQWKSETKDKGFNAVQKHRSKQKYRVCNSKGKHMRSDSKARRECIVREEQEKKQSS